MERKKVIFILIDALGASYFAAQRSRLPYLSSMAEKGFIAERVRPATPGTSRPGRATILTGMDTSEHGIYGNSLLLDGRFRPASDRDLEARTVAQLAAEAGLDVVGLGFGMLRPEHTSLQVEPWWEHLPQQGLSNLKIPNRREIWNVSPVRRDDARRLPAYTEHPLSFAAGNSADAGLHPHLIGLASDQLMLELAADLACSERPPDLILTEFSVTDPIQHHHGFDAAATNWAYQTADMAVGLLMHRLSAAGRLEQFAVIVAGDHGQAPIHTAIYPETILPNAPWTSEGASLQVVLRGSREQADVVQRLAEFGVKRLPGGHLPQAARAEGLVTFVAPKGASFEKRPETGDRRQATGAPVIISTHGLEPGDPGDEAVAIIAGAGMKGNVETGDLLQIAPTIAHALGLSLDGFGARAWT